MENLNLSGAGLGESRPGLRDSGSGSEDSESSGRDSGYLRYLDSGYCGVSVDSGNSGDLGANGSDIRTEDSWIEDSENWEVGVDDWRIDKDDMKPDSLRLGIDNMEAGETGKDLEAGVEVDNWGTGTGHLRSDDEDIGTDETGESWRSTDGPEDSGTRGET